MDCRLATVSGDVLPVSMDGRHPGGPSIIWDGVGVVRKQGSKTPTLSSGTNYDMICTPDPGMIPFCGDMQKPQYA
jgi:hypothetical protein